MFEQILNMVKEHLGNNPEIAAAIPAGQEDAVHNEIATHMANTLNSAPETTGGIGGGLLGKLESGMASGGAVTSALEGGLVSSLTTKFGLSPAITGAIAGALPGLIQKWTNRQKTS